MNTFPRFKIQEVPINCPPTENEVVISAHQHIDNGGHTITIDIYGNMYVETGFFGYSHTNVMLSTVDIDSLIDVLKEAKERISQNNMMNALKGE